MSHVMTCFDMFDLIWAGVVACHELVLSPDSCIRVGARQAHQDISTRTGTGYRHGLLGDFFPRCQDYQEAAADSKRFPRHTLFGERLSRCQDYQAATGGPARNVSVVLVSRQIIRTSTHGPDLVPWRTLLGERLPN